MSNYLITFKLKSDATFSGGDGVAGSIDREVQHDAHGLPYLRGRTVKGLLREASDNILDSLKAVGVPDLAKWETAQNNIFGFSDADERQTGVVHFGHALLPDGVRAIVRQSLAASNNDLGWQGILFSLTAIRRQTANSADGLPVDGSLRTMRVILRETTFHSQLACRQELSAVEKALLTASILVWNRAGTGRNRGRGKLQADLLDGTGNPMTRQGYEAFVEEAAL